MSAVTGIVTGVANIGEGIFNTISSNNRAKQLQQQKEQQAEQLQQYNEELSLTSNEEDSANTQTQTYEEFITGLSSNNKPATSPLVYAVVGFVAIAAVAGGLYLLIRKNKN